MMDRSGGVVCHLEHSVCASARAWGTNAKVKSKVAVVRMAGLSAEWVIANISREGGHCAFTYGTRLLDLTFTPLGDVGDFRDGTGMFAVRPASVCCICSRKKLAGPTVGRWRGGWVRSPAC